MGFADVFYYGQAKIECYVLTDTFIGNTVKITDGNRTWTKVIDKSLKVILTVPGTAKYAISLYQDDIVLYEIEVIVGYGEYVKIPINLDVSTIEGIQNVLNAHRGLEMLTVATTEVTFDVTGYGEMCYQVGAINYWGENDAVMVPKWCLPEKFYMNSANTNVGGYSGSYLYSQLNNDIYSRYPEDVKPYIAETVQVISKGNQSTTTEEVTSNLFLPTEWQVFGATTYATATEHTVGYSTQIEIFKTSANRIKTLGKDGAAVPWWECSPSASNATSFCIVNTSGAAYSGYASTTYGVPPCFTIKAQA